MYIVHLPRNQLFVTRVSPKTRLADILFQVCSEKNLDPVKYSLRHPGNLDQVLSLSCSLADYKLQELTLVCNRTHPVEVSTVDIMSLQRDTSNPAYRNTMCEGSVSSGSLEGRSLSPVPSDESSASPPPLPPNRPTRKRRPAPKPPIASQKTVIEEKQVNGIQTSKVINHSRNSSDSSGYHEASVLSESPQSVPDTLSHNKTEDLSKGPLSQSMTDVSMIQPPLQQATSYNSITSLSSITGRKKKAAPPPPLVGKGRASSLIQDKQRTSSVSSTASSTTTLDGNEMSTTVKSATLPPSSRLNNIPPPSSPPPITTVEIAPSATLQGSDMVMADEEIDRIFTNAIENHSEFEFRREDQITKLPSPPHLLTENDFLETSSVDDPVDWEYRLPAPPTFRDETRSPSVTEFGTITLGNLSEIVCPNTETHIAESNLETIDVDTCENQSDILGNVTLNSTTFDNHTNNNEKSIKLVKENRVDSNSSVVHDLSKLQSDKTAVGCLKQNVVDDLTNTLNQTKPFKTEHQEENRPSCKTLPSNVTLDNFCITTYKDTKPVEVFEDDSIKSSVGEKRDKSKDDAVFRAPKPRVKEPNLSRTSSFSMENKMNGPLVKRSVSYVSLLAVNMPRHSQPYRAHLTEQHSDVLWPKLRKTTSELTIDTKDSAPEPPTWQSPENPPELQSVQVLRNILSQSHANLSFVHQPESTSLSHERYSPTSNVVTENSLNHIDNMKWGSNHSEETVSSKTKWTSRIKFEPSLSLEEEHSNPTNIYRGPPSINLSTWSERPKQQISIKDDGDYRFGFGKKCTRHDDTTKDQLNNNFELSKKSTNYKRNKTEEGFKLEGKSKSISDLSRIPVVTAVELKKPYTVCSFDKAPSKFKQDLTVSNNNSLNSETVLSNDCQNNGDRFIGVNSLARRFGVPNKRPASMYDTGTGRNHFNSIIDDKSEKVNRANTIERNTFSTRKISEGDNELQEKLQSGHNKYDSTSVIKALSKIRSGGIVDDLPDCPNVNMSQSGLNPTSKENNYLSSQSLKKKENKWKEINSTNEENQALFNNRKLTNNISRNDVVNLGPVKQTQNVERNFRPVNLQPVVKGFTRVSIKPPAKTFVSTSYPNVQDSKLSCNVSSSSIYQDCQVYKTAPLNTPTVSLINIKEPAKEKTTSTDYSSEYSAQDCYSGKSKVKSISTVPAPPPPPSLPVLKPVGERKGIKLLPPPAANPRDLLMSSIRSFRRDDLKTLSK